jgi:hypothetical protein
MILRISARLGKKIHVAPAKSLRMDPNPFADWTARLFTTGRGPIIPTIWELLRHNRIKRNKELRHFLDKLGSPSDEIKLVARKLPAEGSRAIRLAASL